MGDLTTLENVREYLNIQTTSEDTLLSRLITAASSFIEKLLCNTFALTSYTEVYDGNGHRKLWVTHTPITSVSSVVVDSKTISPAIDSVSSGYGFTREGIFLYGFWFEKGLQNVRISYSAGYAQIPADVEDECLRIVGLRYKARDRIGVSGKSVGGEHVSYDMGDMSEKVLSNLRAYRKVVLV